MLERKNSGADPYIVFLGAGASISSGCSGMMQIINDVLERRDQSRFRDWQKKIENAASTNQEYGELLLDKISKEKRDHFFEVWDRLDSDSQYAILRRHLWENKSPSNGYTDLAHLVKDGYVKMVLSTNLDSLLEKALNSIGWFQPDNFVVIINRKDKPEEVREQLESSRTSFKLVKLHGTLESPRSYAFAPEEVFDFEKNIKPSLSRIINQSLIVIGHSMQDRDIDVLFEDEGKEIHFVNPRRPEIESRIDIILKVRRRGSVIDGNEATFDDFMRGLRSCTEKELGEASKLDSSPSIEGFLHSIGYDHELEVPCSRFRNLPTLYVKPTEYDDICSKLERKHVIFIIGEPHLGKTYTAFHILWEYYRKNYEVLHVKHDRFVTLLHQHEGNMKELLLDLFTSKAGLPRIVHFDDPFGETMERRTDVFAKDLDTFLGIVRSYEHLRVIVTTRLNIFRESMAEVHDRGKIEELEKDIRVHTSYHPSTLLEVLHNYTRFYKPVWANDKTIVSVLDERLPDLLPAPHNIEFFVRTSENLNSLTGVLNHIEKCKEMVTALGEWMGALPNHEQLFLLWLEICSATDILFPGTSASKMDFESAYMETLAYLFRKKHIEGIPTNPFSRARDKFDMIVLESHDKDAGKTKLDFVHPSYHEAFWYATKNNPALNAWWELLKTKLSSILMGLGRKIDVVQLHMIERYGTINRNLDQLLLISAQSEDLNEQIIALGHMLERREQFEDLPQFSHCYNSIILSGETKHKFVLLKLAEKYSYRFSASFLNSIVRLALDLDWTVRRESQRSINKYLGSMPESVRKSEMMRTLSATENLLSVFPGIYPRHLRKDEDVFNRAAFAIAEFAVYLRRVRGRHLLTRPRTEFVRPLEKLSTEDFQQLFKTSMISVSHQYIFEPPIPARSFLEWMLFFTLLEFEELSENKRKAFLEMKSSPEVVEACNTIKHRLERRRDELFTDKAMTILLTFTDH